MRSVILVTGGAGYVGSHACKALAAAGYLPITFDNLSRGHEAAVRWGPLERGDLLDLDRLKAVILQHRPEAVMHFAALAYVGESVDQPDRYYRNNVTGSLNLLDAMRATGVDRIVFSSSCSTYGPPQRPLLDEDHPQQPISPYGRTKMIVERCLEDYGRAFGIRSVVLRYFNAAGTDPDGEIGEDHDPETHMIPQAVRTALGHEPEFRINGTDFNTPDGTCIRDYVHVTDLAQGHMDALRLLEDGERLAAFNLGTGTGLSVRQVLAAVERICGRPIPTAAGPRRPGDASRLVACTDKAKAGLGWAPRHSDIDTIVQTAFEWLGGDR